MKMVFDIQVDSGEIYKECTLIHYFRNIRGGVTNHILSHASDSIRAFNKDGEELKGVNLLEAKILRAVDLDSELEITNTLDLIPISRMLEKRYID